MCNWMWYMVLFHMFYRFMHSWFFICRLINVWLDFMYTISINCNIRNKKTKMLRNEKHFVIITAHSYSLEEKPTCTTSLLRPFPTGSLNSSVSRTLNPDHIFATHFSLIRHFSRCSRYLWFAVTFAEFSWFPIGFFKILFFFFFCMICCYIC